MQLNSEEWLRRRVSTGCKRRGLMAAAGLLMLCCGLIFWIAATPRYRVRESFLIRSPFSGNPGNSPAPAAFNRGRSQALLECTQLVNSPAFQADVHRHLNQDASHRRVRISLRAYPVNQISVIEVVAAGENPDGVEAAPRRVMELLQARFAAIVRRCDAEALREARSARDAQAARLHQARREPLQSRVLRLRNLEQQIAYMQLMRRLPGRERYVALADRGLLQEHPVRKGTRALFSRTGVAIPLLGIVLGLLGTRVLVRLGMRRRSRSGSSGPS